MDKSEEKFNPQSMDAIIWAKEFMRILHQRLPKIEIDWVVDEDLMRGWFANAIMAGYDEAKRRNQKLYEPLSENDMGLLMYKIIADLGDYEAKENWTGKHIQSSAKKLASDLAHAIYEAWQNKSK
jgi:hypothetical protein